MRARRFRLADGTAFLPMGFPGCTSGIVSMRLIEISQKAILYRTDPI